MSCVIQADLKAERCVYIPLAHLWERAGERELMDQSILRQHARDLRKNSTDAEQYLWYYLRANRMGYKFKRQYPVCRYIVDFICLQRQLVIELDGDQHQVNESRDRTRTADLNLRGLEVLRFWNHEIFLETEGVLMTIHDALVVGPLPNPLPQVGEGK